MLTSYSCKASRNRTPQHGGRLVSARLGRECAPIKTDLLTCFAGNGVESMHRALSTFDVITDILNHLSLPDLISYACTHRNARSFCAAVLRHRFCSVVSHFVAEDIEDWSKLMNSTGAIIIGSAALQVAMGDEDWEPNDLNVVVPEEKSKDVLDFFTDMGYRFSRRGVQEPFHSTVGYLYVLSFGSFRVTVSESKSESVIPPVLCGSNTLEMNAMSSDGIICLYPNLITRKVGVAEKATAQQVLKWRERGIGLYTSCVPWVGGCGSSCPRVWRRAAGLRGMAHLNWGSTSGAGGGNPLFSYLSPGEKSEVATQFSECHMKFRVIDRCNNPFCEYFGVI